jgi:uncharacterized protein YceK
MHNRLAISVFLATAIALSGCASIAGTFAKSNENDVPESRVYAGMRMHKFLWKYAGAECASKLDTFLTRFVFAIDWPLSVVADTVFLPYTLLISPGSDAQPGAQPDATL